jgi:hypothetical protein
LTDPDADVRAMAARVMGEIHYAASPDCQPLLKALADEVAAVRQAAVGALGTMAVPTREVIQRVTGLLSDAECEVRRAAVGSMVTMAQRRRTSDFLIAISRLEQLAHSGPREERMLYRSAVTALRASLPSRSFGSRKSRADSLPRPVEPPEPQTGIFPLVEGE